MNETKVASDARPGKQDVTGRVAATHDCMFHDEQIPDAPCNCKTGEATSGYYEVVAGEVMEVGSDD